MAKKKAPEKPDDETGTEVEVVKSKKRVAADGTQRGLHRKGMKNRRTTLMEQCQTAVEDLTGIKNWDPVVMLAMLSAQALTGYPATDENGNPILDEETGNPVMVPPDRAMAAAVAAKAAPYLHGHVRPKEAGEDEDDKADPNEKREEVLNALESMGVKVKRDE